MKKLLVVALAGAVALTGSMALFSPTSAEARMLGERSWDSKNALWTDERPNRAKSRRASNKSPIPRRVVSFSGNYKVGTIIVDTAERRLYYVMGRGKAMKYGIGVGRDGFRWSGTHRISRKAEWPGWTPPARMIRRVKRETGKQLKSFYPGGPNNPLGARSLYIGSTIYRIHGTNQPWTIGQAMSSGCIRLANDDVTDLYNRAKVGSRVVVRQ